jgi:hypothetical protein
MTTTGWTIWFACLGLGAALVVLAAWRISKGMVRDQEHRHDWRAVAMTNLCRCACGVQTEWWNLPNNEDPFLLGRYWREER